MPDDTDDSADEYDELAADWSAYSEVPWRAQVLWPVLEELLPEVEGARVLDAGCGDGVYTARLANRGANAVGVDASEGMISTARERYGEHATFHQADLADGLDRFDDDSVDLVLSQHVLSHVRALAPVFEAFARVLRPGATLVCSTHHPFNEYLVVREERYPDTRTIDDLDARPAVRARTHPSTYGETEAYDLFWSGSIPEQEQRADSTGSDFVDCDPMRFYRRPLHALTGPLFDAGFAIRDLREPDLNDRLDDDLVDPESPLSRRPPRSLCLRATLEE